MATEQDHTWGILDDMLVFLAGQGVPTPERTYKFDGGWALAMSDLRRYTATLTSERDHLRAELAAAKNIRGGLKWKDVGEREWLELTTRRMQFHWTGPLVPGDRSYGSFLDSAGRSVGYKEAPWVAEVKPANTWIFIGEYRSRRAAKQAAIEAFWSQASVATARAEAAEKELAHWKTQHDIELTTADELACRAGKLSNAAQAVLDRWDSPKWKDQDPTAKVINELRAALAEADRLEKEAANEHDNK